MKDLSYVNLFMQWLACLLCNSFYEVSFQSVELCQLYATSVISRTKSKAPQIQAFGINSSNIWGYTRLEYTNYVNVNGIVNISVHEKYL